MWEKSEPKKQDINGKDKNMYTVEKITNEISVDKYIEEFVNVEEFLECCKVCPNYGTKWSCPPYDFDVLDYWKQYKTLTVVGYKMTFDKEVCEKNYNQEEINKITEEVLSKQKKLMSEELYAMEKQFEGSVSLSAGSCNLCGGSLMGGNYCTRKECPEGKASELCRHYKDMRYSIESIGGNVGKTCTKILRDEIEWIEEGKLPSHFLLVGGLLKK